MRLIRGVLIAGPAIVLATILFGTISLIVSFFDSSGRVQVRVARIWARTLLAVSGVRVVAEGLENIDPERPYIFISNHASFMDTPVALSYIPAQFRFLAKRGLFQIPLLGTHLSRAGHIPVPREDPRASVKTMQLAAETIKSKSISLLIFPEGGRSHDGVMRNFKEGGAYIAIRAGVPVVPVAMIGTRAVLPYGAGIVRPGTVKLQIMPPIETGGLSLKDRGELTQRLREMISAKVNSAAEKVT